MNIPKVPLPTAISIQMVEMSDGENRVEIVLDTPVGIFVHYLDSKAAEKVGMDLINAGRSAKSGLVAVKGNGPVG